MMSKIYFYVSFLTHPGVAQGSEVAWLWLPADQKLSTEVAWLPIEPNTNIKHRSSLASKSANSHTPLYPC